MLEAFFAVFITYAKDSHFAAQFLKTASEVFNLPIKTSIFTP